MLLILVFFSFSSSKNIATNDWLFVSGIFIFSCLIGISLAIYPGWHRRFLKRRIRTDGNQNIQKKARKREGHHPNCDHFKNHTVKIKNKLYCAGCLGIALGCIISIFIMIFYTLIIVKLSSTIFLLLIMLSLIIIGFVYMEIILFKRNTFIHIISNLLLVISFLVITISITEITGNKIYGVISIILSFLWLDTRIQLSNWHHTLICKKCDESCKMY
jgi:hypothetical protein